MSDETSAWTFEHDSHAYAVIGGPDRLTTLRRDGETIEQLTADFWESVTFDVDGLTVEAFYGPRSSIHRVTATRADDSLAVTAPPDSREGRRQRLMEDHPRRYVVQKVLVAGAQVLFGVLGFSALFAALVQGLLPHISWSWLPDVSLPSIPWPDLPAPDWLRYLNPFFWLDQIPWPRPPQWLADAWNTVAPTATYWGPLLVAAVVATSEVRKRRAASDDEPTDDTPPDSK